MTRLYLIRHGSNDYLGKKLAGNLPGVHLNQQGRTQADALADVLAGVKFEAIYTSPLARAIETASPLARSKKMTPRRRKNLSEIDYGTWEGKSLAVLRRRKLWPVVQHTPSLARFPEGESFLEAQVRIVGQLEQIMRDHNKGNDVVACIFHSDPIKLAITHFIGLDFDHFQRLVISPASITVIDVHDHGAFLVAMNDTRATGTVKKG